MSSDMGLLQGMSSDLQQDVSSENPTVDDLLRMLSGGSSSSRKPPPPVPPKPKYGMDTTIEAAKRSLGLITGSKNINKPNNNSQVDTGDTTTFNIEPKAMMNSTRLNLDTQQRMDLTRNTPFDDDVSYIAPTRQSPSWAKAPIVGCVVYDSSTASTATANIKFKPESHIYQEPYMSSNINSRPIVTESPVEANNNNIRRSVNTSTVQIREVPALGQLSYDIHSNNSSNKTFSRNVQRQPAPEYNVPLSRPATIDHGGYGDGGAREDVKLTDKMDVETMMSDILEDRPPRTSTPTSTQYPIDNNSSSGASTATYNNRSSQNTHLSHGTRESNSDNSENDALNISRDTDELTNTSALNQSGCELVGINDNSDSKGNSPKKIEQEQEQPTPYTVQVFNETLMSSSSSPPDRSAKKSTEYKMSIHEIETNSLRKIVNNLQDAIQNLDTKVSDLTTKVDDLEYQLGRQRRDAATNKSTSSIYNDQRDGPSPSEAMQKNSFSRSVSTINKMTPMKGRHGNNYGQMSAYSRNSVASINSQASNTHSTDTSISSSRTITRASNNARRVQPQQQINTSGNINTSMKRLNVNASSNSIYADSNKSGGSASISPTSLTPSNRQQTTSPSSYLSLSHKRDPNNYTSMLSLSSIGNSTLKKASIAGSVSNLSQFGTSQLSNWPSYSNFVQATHQAKDILYDEDEQVIRMILYSNLITMCLPTWLESDYNLDKIVEAPDIKLKLNWVHGYRGRDCRSNIYYLPTGECVYFVASIVVLYNPEEKTQRHYLGHTESVKCLAIHPNKLIVASGQSSVAKKRDKRPIVRVWNTVSLATLRVIGFNEDFDRAICCLAFSKHDTGATLAVVDESSEHTITLLDWQREKNWRLAEANSGHEPVLAIDFHPIDKYSLVAVGKSSINFWDIRGMTLGKKAGLFDKYDKPKYVLCMTFNDLGETVTGDSNGNVIIWPRGANKPRRIIRDAHPGGVFSVLAMKDGSYLTGGRDRRIVEWDENFAPTGRQAELPEHCGGVRFITYARGSQVLIGTLRNSILLGSLDTDFDLIMQGHTEAATALAVHPNLPKYLTGGFDYQMHFIDAQTHTVEWTKCLGMPITAACFSPNGLLLIVGSTSGNWMALDGVTQEMLFTACDGAGTINCIKFSTDGESFCMGSTDCHVYVYQTNQTGNTYRRIGTCVGHSAPIKEIDWSDDNNYFQSQSMNFELLFWRASNCRPIDDDAIVNDLRWSTHNCTIGFNVIGIWSDSIDSALINYCDKSNNSRYIVSVTDTGHINMYNWPTYYNQCLSQKYYGNVDKFNFIKFLNDDSRLIAVGSKSCVTTEWTIDIVDDHL